MVVAIKYGLYLLKRFMHLYKKEHVGTLFLFDEMRENPMCLHRIPTKLKQYIVQQLNEK
jgi:hypothetical protein